MSAKPGYDPHDYDGIYVPDEATEAKHKAERDARERALFERVGAEPPPPNQWEPGSLGVSVWNVGLGRYETWLADEDGEPVERAAWLTDDGPEPDVDGKPDMSGKRDEDVPSTEPAEYIAGAEEDVERREASGAVKSSRLFADEYGDKVRYDHSRRRWLVWGRHRWAPDADKAVNRLWRKTLAQRAQVAVLAGDKAELTEVRRQMSDAAIEGGIRQAAAIQPIANDGKGWDSEPWLMGCENGVVDLRTGVLRKGLPEDVVTKSTRIEYDPEATCPKWEQALLEMFRRDAAVVEWLQRLLGCGVTGVLTVETLAFLTGDGNNGKSTFVDTVKAAVGEYADAITFAVLTALPDKADHHTTSKMVARSGRLLFALESGKESRVNDAALKEWSSADVMTGRGLHENTTRWQPTHTLIAVCNVVPSLAAFDLGTTRRIAIVQFLETFREADDPRPGPRKDYGLRETLKDELQGLLAWIVRGAVEFLKTGTLRPYPPAVEVSTETYINSNDILGAWIHERLVASSGGRIESGDLYDDFVGWCADHDEPVPWVSSAFMKDFAQRAAREFPKAVHGRDHKGRRWLGLAFRGTPDSEPERPEQVSLDLDDQEGADEDQDSRLRDGSDGTSASSIGSPTRGMSRTPVTRVTGPVVDPVQAWGLDADAAPEMTGAGRVCQGCGRGSHPQQTCSQVAVEASA